MAITAPTGVAAINAGGVTIHSFFQLPFSPFIPGDGLINSGEDGPVDKHSLLSRLRYTTEKRKILMQLILISIKNYQNIIFSKLFYFILYLCALEIAPYYFMYYWFTKVIA